MVTLSIIIVNWNTKNYLEKCLRSIYKTSVNFSFETIVIDNNSSDKSTYFVQKHFPNIKLIANTENLGFAKANNQGFKISKGKYILLLNPDTIIHKNSLERMANFMENNKKAASCCARFLNPNGSDQKVGYYGKTPTVANMFLVHSPMRPITLRIPYLRNKFFEHIDFSKTQEIDQPPGACFFTKRSILKKIGVMNEQYQLYFEDVDLAYRIKQHGWKQYFLHDTFITHYGNKSGIQLGYGKRSILYYQSMLKFFNKNYTSNEVIVIKIITFIRLLMALFISFFLFIIYIFYDIKKDKNKIKEDLTLLPKALIFIWRNPKYWKI